MKITRYRSIRWVLLFIALTAIVGITIINLSYVNQVQEISKDSITEKKRELVRMFAAGVRDRFLTVPRQFWKINIEDYRKSIDRTGLPPRQFNDMLSGILADSIFSDAFFLASDKTPCESGAGIWKFNTQKKRFEWSTYFPEMICDGMSVARTRMKVLLNDYRWNTKTTFDTHRTMNIAMVYPQEQRILGYLIVQINTDYLLDTYLRKEIESFFANKDEEVAIWIHDWVRNRVLLTNNAGIEYNRKEIEISEKFPGLFDNWNIQAKVLKPQSLVAIQNQSDKNVVILVLAVALLVVSLIFIIYTSIKEQEISQRQSEFLSNVTHELKTPLAVIQAAGENIKDGRVKNEERLHFYGKHIYSEAVRLKKMIEKLLDVAKSESNQTKARPQVLNAKLLIEEIYERELPQLQAKQFETNLDLKLDDENLFVDKDHFESILFNLIENSIKYSSKERFLHLKGFIEREMIQIEVVDKGNGIPKEAIGHIFEKFYRVEDTLTAHTKGHGLGLSIVKFLVELNQGNIEVESKYGEGTTFILKFPVSNQLKNKALNDQIETEYA